MLIFPTVYEYAHPADSHIYTHLPNAHQVIGQGAFGKVFLGMNLDTGELMAVKHIDTEVACSSDVSACT